MQFGVGGWVGNVCVQTVMWHKSDGHVQSTLKNIIMCEDGHGGTCAPRPQRVRPRRLWKANVLEIHTDHLTAVPQKT